MYKNIELYNNAELYRVFVDMVENRITTEAVAFKEFLNNFSTSAFLDEILTTTDPVFLELQACTETKLSVFRFREIIKKWGTLSSYEEIIKLLLPNTTTITSNATDFFNGKIVATILIDEYTILQDRKSNDLTDAQSDILVYFKEVGVDILRFKQFLIKYTPNPYKIEFDFLTITKAKK